MAMQPVLRGSLGFVAGAVAVLIVHQPIIAALGAAGVIPARVYNMEPLKTAPAALAQMFTIGGLKGWPTIFNQMFWGGMWGAFYGLALSRWSVATWLKGLVLGGLVLVAGTWLLVPLLKNTAIFGGFELKRMLVSAAINVPFGIAAAYVYGMLARRD
jgi:hypothetical protein